MKAWYTSKVFWLGVITTLLGVIPIITDAVAQTAITPATIGTALTGVLIVIVRVWFTNEPVTHPLGIGAQKSDTNTAAK